MSASFSHSLTVPIVLISVPVGELQRGIILSGLLVTIYFEGHLKSLQRTPFRVYAETPEGTPMPIILFPLRPCLCTCILGPS